MEAQSVTLSIPDASVEDRVTVLEEWRRNLPAELSEREQRLRKQVESRVDTTVNSAQRSLNDRVKGLRHYVVGDGRRSWWAVYRGPLLLVVGVLLGLIGNLVALGQ